MYWLWQVQAVPAPDKCNFAPRRSVNTVLRAILRGTVYRLLPKNKATLLIFGIVAFVVLVAANGAKAATNGSCTGSIAASAKLTCDFDAQGASKIAIVVEAACAGGIVPTVAAFRLLDSGNLPEPTSNPLPLTTVQTGDRVCTSGFAGNIRSYEAYGWRKYRVQATNTDSVSRAMTITWAGERPTVTLDPDSQNSVDIAGAPELDVSIQNQPVEVRCVEDTCTSTGGGGGGEVELSVEDRDYLELIFWGIAFLCGLTLVLIAAPDWRNAWRFGKE